ALSLASRQAAQLALAFVIPFAALTYRGAQVSLRQESERAYPVSQSELDTYYWIQTHLPSSAVLAADPQHQVNPAGETIASTNFLSGMTERPAYLQRLLNLYPTETAQRLQVL